MNEQFCDVGRGITLCYEEFGDPDAAPMLLVMGLATQMLGWHEDLCEELAGRGFRVIRFDNRDIGRSTHVEQRPPTNRELLRRRTPPGQYTLSDMADDARGLMRELGIEPAHIVGASMGGMIGQMLAAEHPEAVRSLTSLMSTTGNRWRGQPAPSIYKFLLRRPPATREDVVERAAKIFGVVGTKYEGAEQYIRERAGQSFDRGHDTSAAGRQLGAIVASGDRTQKLRQIDVPTLVIHGTKDKLVRSSGGRATAAAIPGAELILIDGMGHDLPRPLWHRLVHAITEHARRADRAAGRKESDARVPSA